MLNIGWDASPVQSTVLRWIVIVLGRKKLETFDPAVMKALLMKDKRKNVLPEANGKDIWRVFGTVG